MESSKTIFDKIEEKYNLKDENGKQKNKAFFSHLIRSYLPLKSVSVAMDNPESKKVRVKCVFTDKHLTTVEGVLKSSSSDALARNLQDFLKTFDSEKGCFVSVISMKQLLKGKVLALQGKDTKTYMSQESYATFLSWVMTKYIAGDKNIKWLLGEMRSEKLHPGITVKPKKNKPKMYSTKGSKQSTMGDLDALQALKDKFKD